MVSTPRKPTPAGNVMSKIGVGAVRGSVRERTERGIGEEPGRFIDVGDGPHRWSVYSARGRPRDC